MDTGDVIRYLRKRDGLTQQELADRLGVQKSSVQKYESGRVQNLKLETIQNLCRTFEVAPIAFVFPEAWSGNLGLINNGPAYYKFMEMFAVLTEEGITKVLTYAEDIKEIDRYIKVTPVECEILRKPPEE